MAKNITVAQTVIDKTWEAAAEIDRVLNGRVNRRAVASRTDFPPAMLYYSRPVYVGIAVDIVPLPISTESLRTPLVTELPLNDPALEREVIEKIASEVTSVEKTVVIVDGCKSIQICL